MFKTPALNFHPKISLGSLDCSVYLYENDVYVTDFISASDTSIRVFKGVSASSDDEMLK